MPLIQRQQTPSNSGRRYSRVDSLAESFTGISLTSHSNMTLYQTHKIVLNHVAYTAKVYDCDDKYYIEIISKDSIIVATKHLKKKKIDFEALFSKAHVDLIYKKIYIERKVLYNDFCMVSNRKVSLIIYENKIGCYADGFILDNKKSYHFYLGETVRISSVLSKLRILSTVKGEKLIINEY